MEGGLCLESSDLKWETNMGLQPPLQPETRRPVRTRMWLSVVAH